MYLIISKCSLFALALVLCSYQMSGVLGQKTDFAPYVPLQGCSDEAIYYALQFLNNRCLYTNTTECYNNFVQCFEKITYLDLEGLAAECTKIAGKTSTDGVCDLGPTMLQKTLQATCCTKTKASMMGNLTLRQIEDISEGCYDKINCGQTACA